MFCVMIANILHFHLFGVHFKIIKQLYVFIIVGIAKLTGGKLIIACFRNGFADLDWAFFSLSSFKVDYRQLRDGNVVEQSLDLRCMGTGLPHEVVLQVEHVVRKRGILDQNMPASKWFELFVSKVNSKTVIFSIPSCSVNSGMRLIIDKNLVISRFQAAFDDSLGISLDGNRYVFLVDLYKAFSKEIVQQNKPLSTDTDRIRSQTTSVVSSKSEKLSFTCQQDHTMDMDTKERVESHQHGSSCMFVLNPILRPTSIGILKPPDINWVMQNLFHIQGSFDFIYIYIYIYIYVCVCVCVCVLAYYMRIHIIYIYIYIFV